VHVPRAGAAVDAVDRILLVADEPAVPDIAFEHDVVLRAEHVAQRDPRARVNVQPRRIRFDPDLGSQLLRGRFDHHDAERDVGRELARDEVALFIDLLGCEDASRVGVLGRTGLDVRVAHDHRRRERAGVEQRELGAPLVRRRVRRTGCEPGALEDRRRRHLLVALDGDRADLRARTGIEVIEPRDRLVLAIDERAAVAPRVTVTVVLQALCKIAPQRAIHLEVDLAARVERHHRTQLRRVLRRHADQLDRRDRVARSLVELPRDRHAPLIRGIRERRRVDLGVEVAVALEIRPDAAPILGEAELVERARGIDGVADTQAEHRSQLAVRRVETLTVSRLELDRGHGDLRLPRDHGRRLGPARGQDGDDDGNPDAHGCLQFRIRARDA